MTATLQEIDYTIKELRKVKEEVLRQLSNKEQTRNSDTYLALEGLSDMGYVKKTVQGYLIPYDNIYKMPQFEDWKRYRAFFQNKMGLFPPTEEVIKNHRKTRSKVFKRVM